MHAASFWHRKSLIAMSPRALPCLLPPGVGRVILRWSEKRWWLTFVFFSIFSLLPWKIHRSPSCLWLFYFIPWSLDFFFMISSIESLILFNCVIQMKLIIYADFHFSSYSFDFWFVFCSFNFFGMKILFCFNLSSNWNWSYILLFILFLILLIP